VEETGRPVPGRELEPMGIGLLENFRLHDSAGRRLGFYRFT
jgi:hypothetical protein